jgi:hypothetical protein
VVVVDKRTDDSLVGRCAVVGDGRMGRALVASLPWIAGPFGRGFDAADFDTVILAVTDGEIGRAAAVPANPIVGHAAPSARCVGCRRSRCIR